jgi:hypothetical protein
MSDPGSIIEYMSDINIHDGSTTNTEPTHEPPDDSVVVSAGHLEARICELAGHLTAATCRFLLLVADFDARKGWAGWEMPSCAAWLTGNRTVPRAEISHL